MKILIIGGQGTIGKNITHHFQEAHEVLTAGRNSGDLQVDIADSSSIASMLAESGKVDAIVCAAGEAKWDKFEALQESDYHIGFNSKLMGQVNLVRLGLPYLNPLGSITLSTGILADDPVAMTASAAMVNGGIHSFVKAAALEIRNGSRLNVVSLGLVEDAYERYKDYFPGHNPIAMGQAVHAYTKAVMGHNHGEIIRVYN